MDEFQVNIFKALAHPVRLKIAKRLSEGEMCVCEMNEDIEFSQANLSQHLKILKDAKVVNAKKCGMFMYYSIKSGKIKELIRLTEELYYEKE
ncbi:MULTISPECIES: ArsR/SmtB family transcription factor [Clostridium]|uniref:Winged helix-turn-helix transcriptional regulator n=1 Tax=Clostridium paridis TaxID=2803863 RepID=A0A937K5G2_9CLOT|nr:MULTISPECIES: metalloregulator ArsR/SmtB family transcription factor [Clostridium]MBL4933672.1 winged helix-turn-helix transcriptional regulator [Clostridium paridis]